MSWYEYESKADKDRRTQRLIAKRRKAGESLIPVEVIAKRDICSTFWGKAWNRNLMEYSDYENRMPRGRTYLRSGAVLDLSIDKGVVTSVVAGGDLYDVTIRISPLPSERWDRLKSRCAGEIGSLIELLSGKLNDKVMAEVTDLKHGLFPAPREIRKSCSCPDYADLCKHVAATLYAVGVRLDTNPSLLFTLRGVDSTELVTHALKSVGDFAATASDGKESDLGGEDLGALFGIDLSSLDEIPEINPIAEEKPEPEPEANFVVNVLPPAKRNPAKKKAATKVAKKATNKATKTISVKIIETTGSDSGPAKSSKASPKIESGKTIPPLVGKVPAKKTAKKAVKTSKKKPH